MRWADGFIAVDWGTTNRRAYLIDSAGKKASEFEDSQGILSIPSGGFAAAIGEIREKLGDKPLLLAGMIGSNRGWHEVPYRPCPAGIEDLAKGLVRISEREAIVPGLSYLGEGRADIMRGEEVQLLGAAAAGLVEPDGHICHPGTHNKWAVLRNGRIHGFQTVMTGELFSLLKEHSILSDLLQGAVDVNEPFLEGASCAIDHDALPGELFGVRARVLLGKAKKEDAASYTSGLLIGADVRIGLQPAGAQVVIIGRPELTKLYAAAIAITKRPTKELDGESCFISGIHEIAKRIDQ